MRDDIHENKNNPFDPEWYQHAFDQFISTGDYIDNQNILISDGYHIPDVDGSKSSAFRNDAVLNNSFNEDILRNSLRDIYLNSSHKLIASNHDNVDFFKWEGFMSDMNSVTNTKTCEFRIPWNRFITPNERDSFKMSQFYKKWIKVEDIVNNWDIFKWHLILFINQKVYSEYELMIDDQEVTIRFKYNEYWLNNNHPVYIYKFNTNFQHRTLITRELCENQWNWKMPLSYVSDKKITNHSKVMVTFNKITDPEYRKDGRTNIDVLGDNIEFVDIVDGYLDLSTLSIFNKGYILSEFTEWLWMTIFVPKFFHEYPILLPTDTLHRPYQPDLKKVYSKRANNYQFVKSSNAVDPQKDLYVDIKGKLLEDHEGWVEIIRPIVLSDAFENPTVEPLDFIVEEIRAIRDASSNTVSTIESFHDYMSHQTISSEKTSEYLLAISTDMKTLYNEQEKFYYKRLSDMDIAFDNFYKTDFLDAIEDIEINGETSKWFHVSRPYEITFWELVKSMTDIADTLVEKYYMVEIVRGILRRHLWTDPNDFVNKVRFQRPIDVSDFITFEYDSEAYVWRPVPMVVTRHFPDVYMLSDPEDSNHTGRIFKAFFFYSDSMNVLNESRDITRPTQTWDEDVYEYYHNQGAVYRDVFMEKFYWMAIRTIYKGILVTNTRWEIIEHIIDHESFQRFNELFLNTMDPYYKLGLATYLKSDNFEFPFDGAIDKFEESMNQQVNDFKKVTNFEVYLNNSWIPSYFDYIVKIVDDWRFSDRIVKRPSNTFDMAKITPILIEVQEVMIEPSQELFDGIDWVVEKLKVENYNLDVDSLANFRDLVKSVLDNMEEALEFIVNLDLDIYSIKDINDLISMLSKYIAYIEKIKQNIESIQDDVNVNNIHSCKQTNVVKIEELMLILVSDVENVTDTLSSLDMVGFMLSINDLNSYLDGIKTNLDDISLIGQINRFNDPWSMDVKDKRNKLFISTVELNSLFDQNKIYTDEDVFNFVESVHGVKTDIFNFNKSAELFWLRNNLPEDQNILDSLEYVNELIDGFIVNTNQYFEMRNKLVATINDIMSVLEDFNRFDMSDTEKEFITNIRINIRVIVDNLSYLAGLNIKEKVYKAISNINMIIVKWLAFLSVEEEVFNILSEIIKVPNRFIDVMENNLALIQALVDYMDTVNIPFSPDKGIPSLSEVFQIDDVEITSKGFRYNIDDKLFIPNIGSYKVDSVSGDISQVGSISNDSLRRTTFRDPMISSMPYGSVTNGTGSAVTVKALSSTRVPIINDTIIEATIKKIESVIGNINRYTQTPNPHNNIEFNIILKSISTIIEDWEYTASIFSEYMSYNVLTEVNKLVDKFSTLIPPSVEFVKHRAIIDILKLVDDFRTIIHAVYRYSEKNNFSEEDFHFWESQIRRTFTKLTQFVGTGTDWKDVDILEELLLETRDSLAIYIVKIFPILPPSEELDGIKDETEALRDHVSLIIITLHSLPNYSDPINSIVKELYTDMTILYNTMLQRDIWYQMSSINPAVRGTGYKPGDIVSISIKTFDNILKGYWNKSELLPLSDVLEKSRYSGELYLPEDSDVVIETLLFQVVKVNNGEVYEIKPLIDYALPYEVWGIYETVSLTGLGTDLTIDVFSKVITIDDSTLTQGNTKPDDQVGENDLIMFKFENIHDLNINYEVFIGGHQVTNFIHRHETVEDPLHPGEIDVLYLDAKEVLGLRYSSINIPAEQYFVYKINEIVIKDPGAGYAVGQDIYIDAAHTMLRLEVESLKNSPYKEISSINMSDGNIFFDKIDPYGFDSHVVDDTLNNIDDEFSISYYDKIPKEGIAKPATLSYPQDEYEFISTRFDNLDGDDRNDSFMYPKVNPLDVEHGDPDYGWYQGTRVDNSILSVTDDVWNGIMSLIPTTDPFITDDKRTPPNQPVLSEFQEFDRLLIHSDESETLGDIAVDTFADLPKHTHDWPEGAMGKTVIVENDETNNGHRMLYTIRTFVATGFFVFHIPVLADLKWDHIEVNWMDMDWYPDKPTLKQQYPSAPWRESESFKLIEEGISDGKYPNELIPKIVNNTTFIDKLSVDDLSVFNWTTKTWEDLNDDTRWRLDVYNDTPLEDWGFRLTFLETGFYSYDMKFYFNKTASVQKRNVQLKKNAVFDISTIIAAEVNTPAYSLSVNTGRDIRIRKLFPYEQKESFKVGYDLERNPLGYEMNFTLAPYMHFKNELHLSDVKIFNKSANRFENVLDRSLFEVRFKDDKCNNRGFELQTNIVNSIIADAGEGFSDGSVWGWNNEYGIHIFGNITASAGTSGFITTFVPTHCPNPPKEDILLEFNIYQKPIQTSRHTGIVLVEFKTEMVEVFGDGYIHNVSNPMAPLPKEFKIISQLTPDNTLEYEVIVDKTPRVWSFVESEWILAPTFHIPGYNVNQNRLYVMTDRGRFPLVNPSTYMPTISVVEGDLGTDVKFLNLYRRYEHIEIHSVPYEMRSVYVQRTVPKHGYINLNGKINKPLNKKYFEFWMNGKLLNEEVTIISPTKLFMHGLTSLRNFEIIEINRDPNEYFSDGFLGSRNLPEVRPSRITNYWDFDTYLDKALEGKLDGDNYTIEEQEYLLTPVWKQVGQDHPSFKDYPPNVDVEDDIILRVHIEDLPIVGMDDSSYQFMMVDLPTLEGIQIAGNNMVWESFGWIPVSNEDIVDIIQDEWSYEIENDPYFPSPVIVSDSEWFGTTVKMYDEYGISVQSLNEAVYVVHDDKKLHINVDKKSSRFIDFQTVYDLN